MPLVVVMVLLWVVEGHHGCIGLTLGCSFSIRLNQHPIQHIQRCGMALGQLFSSSDAQRSFVSYSNQVPTGVRGSTHPKCLTTTGNLYVSLASISLEAENVGPAVGRLQAVCASQITAVLLQST